MVCLNHCSVFVPCLTFSVDSSCTLLYIYLLSCPPHTFIHFFMHRSLCPPHAPPITLPVSYSYFVHVVLILLFLLFVTAVLFAVFGALSHILTRACLALEKTCTYTSFSQAVGRVRLSQCVGGINSPLLSSVCGGRLRSVGKVTALLHSHFGGGIFALSLSPCRFFPLSSTWAAVVAQTPRSCGPTR